MVLRRVGRQFVDVLVNGTQVDSFEQTGERADYDVSVSDDSTSFETVFQGRTEFDIPDNTTVQLASQYGLNAEGSEGIDGRTPDEVRLRGSANKGNGEVNVFIKDSNNNVLANTTGTLADSGWIDASNNFEDLGIENDSGTNSLIEWELMLRYNGIQSGFTVNGATQS